MNKTGVGRFLTVIVITSFTSGAAFAQAPVQTNEPARPQSTNQIVGPSDQKPAKSEQKPVASEQKLVVTEQKPAASEQKIVVSEQKPAEPKASTEQTTPQKQREPQLEVENAVIPPAPLIVKRNTNAILIPKDGAASTANPGSKYEERQTVSSNVSVGSVFGYRRDPFTRRAKFHAGVDIKARWGDPVGASQAGVVTFAGWYHGYGNLIVISHGGGVATHYAHLSSFDVEVGTRVERGTIIGRAGSTGRATSPHLHYEVRLDGNALNPFQTLTLDASSDYFKQVRPTVDAGRSDSTSIVAPQRGK